MPSLNIDLDFFNHPKTKRLQSILGPGSEVYLIRLWAYVGKYHAANGALKNYTPGEIKTLVDFPGNAQAMLQAMLKVGFINKTKSGYQIQDWLEHEGHLITFQRRAKFAAASRWAHRINKDTKREANASSNAISNALTLHSIAVHNIAEEKKGEAPFILPDWVDSRTWDNYMEVRKMKRAGKKAGALNLIIKDLEKFKAEGQNPNLILENSIKSGWAGVFPLRKDFKKPSCGAAAPVPGKYKSDFVIEDGVVIKGDKL